MSGELTDLGPSRVLLDDDEIHPTLTPRDAASLILIDRSRGQPRVLVGKRARAHVFMPDLYVFPGGRRDPGDGRRAVAAPLKAPVLERLMARTTSRFLPSTARALAVAAARELEEEVALSLNPSHEVSGFRPDLSQLRYVARATTPPGRNRRYDTRFFACFTDEVAADCDAARASEELIDLFWLPLDRLDAVPLPPITETILDDLCRSLAADPNLPFGAPVPYYYTRNNRSLREII
ncbi:NUDIX domain-containing protein [Pseudohoeflea coraliihabitans]|uniref:NUDIX hydrolase n=1 Tax=Pseudohoeflea coraliihabitans TaxID=2860393 RepID=A0ABS6WSI8_9HYPH|nr:NUDIX hydrolase [Pseudohoeflea sp. DP4N28-3]MBW3098911.1 NUDIX hydrolase [Pseudohoeflea sp. DP4N28-3]